MDRVSEARAELLAAIEHGVEAVLDRRLDELVERIADEVAQRRSVDRLRNRLNHRYLARDAAAWIESRFERRAAPAKVRLTLWRWREGRTTWAGRSTIERMIRTLGGDPIDLPDELPEVEGIAA